jgi:hypothetical protein
MEWAFVSKWEIVKCGDQKPIGLEEEKKSKLVGLEESPCALAHSPKSFVL